MSAAGAIEVRDLRLEWGGSPVLAGLDLSVEPGSFLAIVGPSGCGKSTILRVLAGLLAPDGGTATIGGTDVRGAPGHTAWLPQRDNLLPWRRVLANATLGAEVAGIAPADAQAQARALLARFGLGDVERSWPWELSGGMRQRVALLRTFLIPSAVLLLDEPFGALDALTRRAMQSWLQEVWLADAAQGQPRTVVLVTHDVEEALLLADRVVVLSGRPASVVADVAVPFERPRSADLVARPEVVELRRQLLADLGV